MRVVAIIPARYDSSRFKGKPLADLCGRPMLWWVYHQVRKCKNIGEVWVATDHEAIRQVCGEYQIPCKLTSPQCPTSTQRVWEVAQSLPADLYVCVNGDEPLIDPQVIDQVVPSSLEGFFAANLMAPIHSPVEAVDETNIKVVAGEDGNALFFSRSPIPHPKASVDYSFYKHLGVLAYTKEALAFFDSAPRGPLETVEDINELRFIEHGKRLQMIPVQAKSLSVGTPKDLEYVRAVLREKLRKGEI